MRIALIVAGCAVLLVLVVAGSVVGIGMLLPQRHVVARSAHYRAAPEQLFSLIAGSQDWRPDVLRSEVTRDASGRELLRETARTGGTMTYEVFDSVPPKSITRRIAGKNLPYAGSWTYSLTPADNGTVVRITEDGEIYNPVFRFMSHFVLGHTSTMDAYLRALGKATGQEVQVTD